MLDCTEAVPEKEIPRKVVIEKDFIPIFQEEEQKPIEKLQDLVSFALQEWNKILKCPNT